jgi:Pentapeptide repeats (8 copies)
MNATVTAAAIGVGGSVIVALAAFWASVRNTKKTTDLTHRALELTEQGVKLTEQGQMTERYTRAIEQIGSDKSLPVRIGGIYALERVARDSARDHPTVMEVLAFFIREHSGKQWQRAEAAVEPPERTICPDVQAAVTVIGRRDHENDRQPINLADAKLIRAYLTGAYLTRANLHHADLTYAVLDSADLTGADLNHAKLRDARLRDAKLPDARLARVPHRRGPWRCRPYPRKPHRRGPHPRVPRQREPHWCEPLRRDVARRRASP